MKRALRVRDLSLRLWGLGLGAGVVGVLVDAAVSFPLHLPASALNLVVLVGVLHARVFDAEQRAWELKRGTILVLAGVTLLVAVVVSLLAYRDWRADIHLKAGQREFERQRYNTAIAELETSVALAFQPTEALYYLGTSYARLGEYERARAMLERSLRHFVTEGSYVQLANAHFNLKSYIQTLTAIETLLSVDPHRAIKREARYLLALSHLRSGDAQTAIANVLALQQDEPDYERAYLAAAEAYGASGQREEAIRQLNEADQLIDEKLRTLEAQIEQMVTSQRAGERISTQKLRQLRDDRDSLRRAKERTRELLRRFAP